MNNLCLFKNGKYDSLVESILMYVYFVHQFFFIFSASALARDVEIVGRFANAVIIFTFLIIIMADVYYFFRGKFSIKELAVYSIIGMIFLISFLHYKVVMVFANLFAISCFKNVDVKKFLKIYLMATVLGCLFNLAISICTPFTFNKITTRYGMERTRYGLGFYWVTFSAHYFYSIVFMYILFKEKLQIVDYTVIMIINIILFLLTDTKAVFIYIIILLIVECIMQRKCDTILYKVFGIFTVISFIFCASVSYFLSAFYDPANKFMSLINKLLSGRLTLMHRGLERWGFTLWGQTIPIKETGNTIDSSMVSMLMQNGFIVYIICIAFMTYFAYLAYKKKYIPLLIALFAVAIRSAFDLGFMALQFGPVVILFYNVLEQKKFPNY